MLTHRLMSRWVSVPLFSRPIPDRCRRNGRQDPTAGKLRQSTMKSIWDQFKNRGVPGELVDRLREAYGELKENFYLGRHRPSELEGGHFAEAAIRILQWGTGGNPDGGSYTPVGTKLPPFDREVQRLASLPGTFDKSLRVYIPRVLLSIYDVRNTRGVGHLAGEINPNLADATLVATTCDWVMAELVRLFHGTSIDEAQAIVDGLVERRLPVVEMFGDFPKVLLTELSNPKKTLVILYNRGRVGATSGQIGEWLRIEEKEARRILRRHDRKALVHYLDSEDRGILTRRGIVKVEAGYDPDFLLFESA